VSVIREEGKGGACGKATKGIPIEGASMSCKGRSAGKKAKESRGEEGNTHG